MPKYSAPDAFLPAVRRAKALLFQPFRFSFWCRLALLGLLTGELTAGGCSFRGSFPTGLGRDRGQQQFFAASDVWERLAPHFWIIFALGAAFFVLMIVFMYISARARFMLFDAILDGDTRLRPAWHKWKNAGANFFLFLLSYTGIVWGLLALFVGLPLLIAYATGFNIREHTLTAALGITGMLAVGLTVIVVGTVIYVLVKDFAVPIMALEGLTVLPALKKLADIIAQQKGSFAGYIGMKIVLTLGAGIVFGIGTFIIVMPVVLVIAIAAVVSILVGASAGLTWTPVTIAFAVALGANAVLGISILVLFGHTPVAAFFPGYALLYFAGRYAPLHDRLFPPPPPANIAPTQPPPDLPPHPAIG